MHQTKSAKGKDIFRGKHWRIHCLVLFVFLGATAIFFRLYGLQVKAYESYRDLADNQHTVFQTLSASRGEIYMQDGNDLYPLAVNRDFPFVYAVPREISNPREEASAVASILELEEKNLESKFSNSNDAYEIVKRRISDDEEREIRERKLPGIYISQERLRFYPGGELASQTVGFVGSDGEQYKGRYGIEAFWENELNGKTGTLHQEKDAAGRWISIGSRIVTPPKDGADLVLTVNHTVQFEIEKILRETIETHSADGGMIVVMEPKTGKILAMANHPTFNANEYSKVEDMTNFTNAAVGGVYEPGSIFKTFTMAMGLEEKKINPDTIYVDSGFVNEAGYTIKNSDEKGYGTRTMTQVLEQSLNTGSIFVEKQVGNEKFYDYVKKFGFGEPTGVELPGEVRGNIRNLENLKRNIQFFTASFGHGISVTPIQMISAYGAIANGGKLMKPLIVDEIKYADGTVEEKEPQEVRRVLSQESVNLLGKMLRSVVVNGHGKRADVPGYLVAGKTGTAQVAKSGEKGYEDNMTIGSFAGYAPLNDPQFAVLVKIDNPKDVEWAESTAAPAFGKVMKYLLEYYHVKPNTPEELSIVGKH